MPHSQRVVLFLLWDEDLRAVGLLGSPVLKRGTGREPWPLLARWRAEGMGERHITATAGGGLRVLGTLPRGQISAALCGLAAPFSGCGARQGFPGQ